MKLYLVNKNPIITKLVTLSASKIGLSVEESQEIDITNNSDILLLDDECYEETLFNSYKANNSNAKSVLFFSKSTDRIEGFDECVQKPFLPTDFLKLLSRLTGIATEDTHSDSDMSDDISQFNDDSLDSLGLDGDIDLSALDDLGLDDEDSNMDTNNNTSVLDTDDVNEIKSLLDDNAESSTSDTGLDDVSLDIDSNNALENPMDGSNESFEFDKEQLGEISADDISKETNNNDEIDTSELLSEFDEKKDDSIGADGILDDLSFDDELAQEQTGVDAEDSSLMSVDADNIDSMENLGNSVEALGNTDSSIEAENQENSTLDDIGMDLSDIGIEADLEESSKENDSLNNIADDASVDTNDSLADYVSLESADEFSSNTDDVIDSLNENKEQDTVSTETQDDLEQELNEIPQDTLDEVGVHNESVPTTDELRESKQAKDNEFSSLSLEGLSEALGEPLTKEPNTDPIIPKDEPKESINLPTNISATSLDGLIGALQALQTQNLKDLLNGATINISIQFPNKDNL